MMNRRDALVAGAGFAAGMVLGTGRARAGALSRAWGRLSDNPETFFPWREIARGVHAVVDPETGGNTLLVVGEGESLLADTKFPAIGKALYREAVARGTRLRYAVNTHHHGDHTGGNQAFNAAGVRLLAHKKAEPRILGNMDQYIAGVTGGARMVGGLKRPTQPAVLDEAGELSRQLTHLEATDWAPSELMAGDRQTLKFGGRLAELTHFGLNAHTDNDVVIFLPDVNVLHTGDLVFNNLHPFFDPTGGVSARGWIEALGKARALCDKDTVVLPGHGDVGDVTAIDRAQSYLRSIIDAVQKEIDAGTSREDALTKTWPFMDGLGFEQVRPRAIGAVYDELKGQG